MVNDLIISKVIIQFFKKSRNLKCTLYLKLTPLCPKPLPPDDHRHMHTLHKVTHFPYIDLFHLISL